MSEQSQLITAAELRFYPWQQLIKDSGETLIHDFYKAFNIGYEQCEKESDLRGITLYKYLKTISLYRSSYDSSVDRYQPVASKVGGHRTATPDDLLDEELSVWAEIYNEIEDPEFRARIADILWIRRKDHKAAQCAIGAFLESAIRQYNGVHWGHYIERIDRAVTISLKRGFESQRSEVITQIEKAILEFKKNSETGLVCDRLMGLLQLSGDGDKNEYLELSQKLAKKFSTMKKWLWAQAYWACAERWGRMLGDQGIVFESIRQAGECHILRAEEALCKHPPDNLYAANWLGIGLEALRRGKASDSKIKEIHKRLLDVQSKGIGELRPVDIDHGAIPGLKEDRERCIDACIKHVTGRDFESAIKNLAFCGDPTNVEELKNSLDVARKGVIAHRLFQTVQLDSSGKTVGVMPASDFGEDDSNHEAMVHQARQVYWTTAAEWRLEPAKSTIFNEHPIRRADLEFLVANNPFIPDGREYIYLRGIQAGFYGDWLQSMHFLIPQLEASFRYILQQHGAVTSTLDVNGIQQEKDINQILWDEKLEEILGKDILFDLRGILISRFGRNMRNEFAHGLMNEGDFYRGESLYLWWLVIRLCVTGYKSTVASS